MKIPSKENDAHQIAKTLFLQSMENGWTELYWEGMPESWKSAFDVYQINCLGQSCCMECPRDATAGIHELMGVVKRNCSSANSEV